MRETARPYSVLASVYPALMRHINYKKWADYIKKIITRYTDGNPGILELAAGNCLLSAHIHREFKNIILSDISSSMLKSSRTRTPPKVCCDMRVLPFRQLFDFVFLTYDSINYLSDMQSLSSFISEVKKIIRRRGILTFDTVTEINSLKYEKTMNRSGQFGGITYEQISNYDADLRIHTNKFRITSGDGTYHEEIHIQKIFALSAYTDILKGAGFRLEGIFDIFSFKTIDTSAERVQIIARREE